MPDFTKYPRGTSSAHVPRPYPPPWESRPGKVSLIPTAVRARELEPLTKVSGSDVVPQGELAGVPSPIRAWIREAIRGRLQWDLHRQKVWPISARSRLVARPQDVYWVRVWIPRNLATGKPAQCILRGWRRIEGREPWTAFTPTIHWPWRTHAPGRPISVKEAKEAMKGNA